MFSNLKKILFLPIFLYVFTIHAYAQGLLYKDFIIKDFKSEITILQDSTVIIVETIKVDFIEEKHGIYREILCKTYDTEDNYNVTSITILSVTDKEGNNIHYSIENNKNTLSIIIGDQNKTLKGIYTYVIKYKLENAIFFDKSGDSFFWDVTGYWFRFIDNVNVFISFNLQGTPTILSTYCKILNLNNQTFNCEYKQTKEKIEFKSCRALNNEEKLYIGITFEHGLIDEPHFLKQVWWFILKNPIIVTIFIPLLIILLLYSNSKFDLKKIIEFSKSTKIFSNDQSNLELMQILSPAEMSFIVSEEITPHLIVSEIIYLAIKGYIKIEMEKSNGILKNYEYYFTRVKGEDCFLNTFEKLFLTVLFQSDKKIDFSKALKRIKKNVEDMESSLIKDLSNKGYIEKTALNYNSKVKTYCYIALVLVAILAIVLDILKLDTPLIRHLFYGICLGTLVFLAHLYSKPFTTKKGNKVYKSIITFKNFVNTYIEKRIFDENTFLQLFPYILALGIEIKLWSKKLTGFNLQTNIDKFFSVGDYKGISGSHREFINFIENLSSKTTKLIQGGAILGSTGSGGSGSGGGGGGGGSW